MKFKNLRRIVIGFFRSTVAVIGSVAILSTGIPAMADNSDGSEPQVEDGRYLVNTVNHTDKSFDELEYYDLSREDFDKLTDKLNKLLSKKNAADDVLDLIYEMDIFFSKASTNVTLSDIYTTLDTDNEEYVELYQDYYSFAVDISDQLFINYRAVAESQYSKEFEEYVDNEEDWEEILEYEPLTDEQRELIEKETELSKKYESLYNDEYICEVSDTTYTEDELLEAYDSDDIEAYDFYFGLAQITEQRNEVLGNLFLELVDVRTQLAKTYGYDNYADYAYKEEYGRDYSYDDLEAYNNDIIKYYTPLLSDLQDFANDIDNDGMDDIQLSKDDCYKMFTSKFDSISPDLEECFDYMVSHDLCNMDISDKKAPTSFTTTIEGDYNCPFLTVDADGSFHDLSTLIHEFGHYNQAYYQTEDEYLYSSTNLDIAEIHSQGLEIIYSNYADELYGDFAEYMMANNDFQYVYAAVEGCKENEFQIAVYKNADNLTLEKLNEMYYEYSEKYGDLELFYNSYYLAMAGMLEKGQIYEWVEIPHTTQSPLYYVSYSVSMAAVEEIRAMLLEDWDAGIEAYFDVVAYGASGKYYEALEEAGINNPIENPRFALYSYNIRNELGMEQPEELLEAVAEITGDESIIPANTDNKDKDSNKDKKKDKEKNKNKDTDKDKKTKDKSSSKDKEVKTIEKKDKSATISTTLYIVLGALLVVLGIIVVIVIAVVNSTKKKKAQSASNNSGLATDNSNNNVVTTTITTENVSGANAVNEDAPKTEIKEEVKEEAKEEIEEIKDETKEEITEEVKDEAKEQVAESSNKSSENNDQNNDENN